jgi:hypothetical protein
MLLRAAIVWVIIALAETLHGILRVRFLNRRLGAHRANQIGVLSGSALIMAICWLLVPWITPESVRECLAAGGVWLFLMLIFEFGLGHWYFRRSWQRLVEEFDLRKGGFLGLGMMVLFFAPLIIAEIRDLL